MKVTFEQLKQPQSGLNFYMALTAKRLDASCRDVRSAPDQSALATALIASLFHSTTGNGDIIPDAPTQRITPAQLNSDPVFDR